MELPWYLQSEGVRFVRHAVYERELFGLAQARNMNALATAAQMECDLVAAGGYPSGSYYVRLLLLNAGADAWQFAMNALEEQEKGSAQKALFFLDHQRVISEMASQSCTPSSPLSSAQQ